MHLSFQGPRIREAASLTKPAHWPVCPYSKHACRRMPCLLRAFLRPRSSSEARHCSLSVLNLRAPGTEPQAPSLPQHGMVFGQGGDSFTRLKQIKGTSTQREALSRASGSLGGPGAPHRSEQGAEDDPGQAEPGIRTSHKTPCLWVSRS